MGSMYWLSTPAAGYSVDNLPPATPAAFTGQSVAGTTKLYWDRNTETDLAGYRLHRGSSVTFTPGSDHLACALSGTGYVDAAGGPYVYKLTAIESHGNESPAATLIPNGTVDVNEAVPPALSFAVPSPNSVCGATTLEYTLSRARHVRLSVYDAAGRDLASGLYLVRLEAEGRVLTRRLAAIR
jgi:hypothetical protein